MLVKNKFIGGFRDGITEEIDSTIHDKLRIFNGEWIEESNQGEIIHHDDGFILGGKHTSNWISAKLHIYKANLNLRDENGYIVYYFNREQDCLRCEGINKNGKRCKSRSRITSLFCGTHKDKCDRNIDHDFGHR